MTLDLDTIFQVAEASPLFDMVEDELRESGQYPDVIEKFIRLQRDCGLEIEFQMNNGQPNKMTGPETAALWSGYRPVTLERLEVLHEAVSLISDGHFKDEVRAALEYLPRASPTPMQLPAPKP